VEQHVYPWTVVSVSYHYKHPTKHVTTNYKADNIVISFNVTGPHHDIGENLLTTITHLNCVVVP